MRHERPMVTTHRPQPWRPTLSTDATEPKAKCHGDLVLEQAEREGRIGSPNIGCPSEEGRYTESWYERHPDKLPANPMTMTDKAKRIAERVRLEKIAAAERAAAEQEALPAKRKRRAKGTRDRAEYMRGYNARRRAAEAAAAGNEPLTMTRPAAVGGHASKSQFRADTAAAAPTRQRGLERPGGRGAMGSARDPSKTQEAVSP
jgi:hypothetical protein